MSRTPDDRHVAVARVGDRWVYNLTRTLTRDDVENLRARNIKNRPVRSIWKRKFKQLHDSGGYQYNGDTLAFATNDPLSPGLTEEQLWEVVTTVAVWVNGQHRGLGFLDSDAETFPAILVIGTAPEATSTIDQPSGGGRSVSDILQYDPYGRQVKNSGSVAAIARILVSGQTGQTNPDRPDIAEWIDQHIDEMELEEWANWSKRLAEKAIRIPTPGSVKGTTVMTASAMGALAVHMKQQGADPTQVREFFERLAGRPGDYHDPTGVIAWLCKRQIGGTTLCKPSGSALGLRGLLSEYHVYIEMYNMWSTQTNLKPGRPARSNPKSFAELPKVEAK